MDSTLHEHTFICSREDFQLFHPMRNDFTHGCFAVVMGEGDRFNDKQQGLFNCDEAACLTECARKSALGTARATPKDEFGYGWCMLTQISRLYDCTTDSINSNEISERFHISQQIK